MSDEHSASATPSSPIPSQELFLPATLIVERNGNVIFSSWKMKQILNRNGLPELKSACDLFCEDANRNALLEALQSAGKVADLPPLTVTLGKEEIELSFTHHNFYVGNSDSHVLIVARPLQKSTGGQGSIQEELEALQTDLSSQILSTIEAIEDARLKAKEEASLEAELKTAEAVQESLFPSSTIPSSLEFAAHFQPAQSVGGDWFWFERNPKDPRFFDIVIADITGHGVPAALLTGVLCGAISAMGSRTQETHSTEARLQGTAEMLNRIVLSTGRGTHFATAALVTLDLQTGKGWCLNAAHPPPCLISAETAKVKYLPAPSSRLGHSSIPSFSLKTFELKPGDTLFLYTDGLIENHASDGSPMSMVALRKLLEQNRDSAKTLMKAVSDVSKQLWKDTPLQDDVTAIACRWLGPCEDLTSLTDASTPEVIQKEAQLPPRSAPVIYMINSEDELIYFNEDWRRFSNENAETPVRLAPESIVGSSIWDHITGGAIVDLYMEIVRFVRKNDAAVTFAYRCDSPRVERHLKMTIAHVGEGIVQFTSMVDKVVPIAAGDTTDDVQKRFSHLKVCSMCKRIATLSGTWLELRDAIKRGSLLEKEAIQLVEPAVCEECTQRIAKAKQVQA